MSADGRDPDAVAETREQRLLLETMGQVETVLADLEAQEAADPDQAQPDAETRGALQALCTADDAPLEWRSIADRVERGTQTWDRVWRRPRPEEGEAGVSLKTRVLTTMSRSAFASLADAEEALLRQADEINRRRMGG